MSQGTHTCLGLGLEPNSHARAERNDLGIDSPRISTATFSLRVPEHISFPLRSPLSDLPGLSARRPRLPGPAHHRLGSLPCLSSHLCVQFHDVSHLVPAKAHKPPVVLGAVPSHDHVRLEVGLPLHPVRRGGGPPLGEVRGRVAFCPDVVPGTQGEKPLSGRKADERKKRWMLRQS